MKKQTDKTDISANPEGSKKDLKAFLNGLKNRNNKILVNNSKTHKNSLKIENNAIQVVLTKSMLWGLFKKAFQLTAKKAFVESPDALANIAPLIEYFIRHPDFFKRKRLVTQLGGEQLQPSFEKGLLIIGGYGNGKTSMMEALQLVFDTYRMPMRFKGYKAHELVTTYERIGADPLYQESSKYEFFHGLTTAKGLYIDDVKKEREASNYGKVNLIRDILEKRYDHGKGYTYITCNYREGDQQFLLEDALAEFGEKYGGHIYDRLFEKFNILEFKGSTFRR